MFKPLPDDSSMSVETPTSKSDETKKLERTDSTPTLPLFKRPAPKAREKKIKVGAPVKRKPLKDAEPPKGEPERKPLVLGTKELSMDQIDSAFQAVRHGCIEPMERLTIPMIVKIIEDEGKVKLTDKTIAKFSHIFLTFSHAMTAAFTMKAQEILSLPDGMVMHVQAISKH